jgi:hypothetical protein
VLVTELRDHEAGVAIEEIPQVQTMEEVVLEAEVKLGILLVGQRLRALLQWVYTSIGRGDRGRKQSVNVSEDVRIPNPMHPVSIGIYSKFIEQGDSQS